MDDGKNEVINRFKSLVESGRMRPSRYALLRVDKNLDNEKSKYFKKWNDFMAACGYEPQKPRSTYKGPREHWNKEKIKSRILELHSKNISLSVKNIRDNFHSLLSAAGCYFNGWENALKYSGIDTDLFIKRKQKLSREETINQAMQLHLSGEKMNSAYVREHYPLLRYSAKKYFGTWTKFLVHLGIRKDLVERAEKFKNKWNREQILQYINDRYKNNLSVNWSTINKINKSLTSSARGFFGSWEKTLLAANLDPEKIRRNKKFWTPKLVLDKIKERVKNNLKLYNETICRDESSLYVYGKRFFGSWRKAVKAAGFVYKKQSCKCLGEDVCYHLLKSFFGNNEEIIRHYDDFEWVKKECGVNTHFDFYIPSFNLLVELQGPTHFNPVFGDDEFEKQKIRDNRKRRLTKKYGVKLLEIKYDKLLPKKVSNQLKKLNIPHIFSNEKLGFCNYYLGKTLRKSKLIKEIL